LTEVQTLCDENMRVMLGKMCRDERVVKNAGLQVELIMLWMLEEQSRRDRYLKARRRVITCVRAAPLAPSQRYDADGSFLRSQLFVLFSTHKICYKSDSLVELMMRISMTPILRLFLPQCRSQSWYELDVALDQPPVALETVRAKRVSPSQTRFDSTTSRPSAHHNNAGTIPCAARFAVCS
jgi:hypothetical protein